MKKIVCPICGHEFKVRTPEFEEIIKCPECGSEVEVREEKDGEDT